MGKSSSAPGSLLRDKDDEDYNGINPRPLYDPERDDPVLCAQISVALKDWTAPKPRRAEARIDAIMAALDDEEP